MACTDLSITPQHLQFLRSLGHGPVLVDVRREERFMEDPAMIAGAVRRRHDEVERWAGTMIGREPVVYCVHGHEIGQNAAAALRERGVKARYLEGGVEAWREAGLPLVRRESALEAQSSGHWVTRERPKIDRLACPWLVLRFIDANARFEYLPAPQVLGHAEKSGATAFDIPGGRFEHDGPLCTFDTMLRHFGLTDPALQRLATIVRGADTAQPDLAPQCAGLLAISLGLGRVFLDDHALLRAALPLYDALYAWCRDPDSETHNWTPAPA
jgi:rhodanese-related sulfurtransferase